MTERTPINPTETEGMTPGSTKIAVPLNPAQLEARRANAKKSTGPRSLAGKIRSSQNALKDGRYRAPSVAYAQAYHNRMEELGEDPAQFAEIENGLRASFLPSNEMETMLVHQIASLEWQRQRLERGQAALLARRMRKLEIKRERESLKVSQKISSQIPTAQLTVGLLWHKDESPTKYQKLLEWLQTLQGSIELKDYSTARTIVGWIYGKVPSMRGAHIQALFCKLAEAKPEAPPDDSVVSSLRLELLREISDVTSQYNLYLREHTDLTPIMLDECLAPNRKQRDLATQLSVVDRRIDQKVRLLLTLKKSAAERDPAGKPGREGQ